MMMKLIWMYYAWSAICAKLGKRHTYQWIAIEFYQVYSEAKSSVPGGSNELVE